jgi:hypothetical protein
MASDHQPRKHDVKVPLLDPVSEIKNNIEKEHGRFSITETTGDCGV